MEDKQKTNLMLDEQRRIVEVTIGFDVAEEKIEYIKSDFLDERYGYKKPIEYTAELLQRGLEYWIREKIGIFCPECSVEMQEDWVFCPNCGWNSNEE